jgi:fatty acid desaturase
MIVASAQVEAGMATLKLVGTVRRQGEPFSLQSFNRFSRFKSVVGALLIASAIIGFVIAALVLGSIVALMLLVVVAFALVLAVVRSAIRQLPAISKSRRSHLSRTRPNLNR